MSFEKNSPKFEFNALQKTLLKINFCSLQCQLEKVLKNPG